MAGSKTLKVIITGDAKGALKAFKDLDRAAGDSAKKAGGVSKAFKIGAAGAAAGVAALVGVAAKSIGTYEKVGVEVLKLQKFTGDTAEATSRLRVAFKEAGVPIDKAQVALKTLSKQLVADKVDEYSKAIDGVSVKTRDAHNHLLPMSTILLNLADRFKTIKNPIDRAAYATKLFGKAGIDMLPFLMRGSAGIKTLMDLSDKYGATLTGKDLDAIKKSREQHRLLTLGMEGLQIQIGRYLLPMVNTMVEYFTTHLPGAIKTVQDVLGHIAPVIKVVGDAFGALPDFVKIGIAGLALLGPAIAIVSKVFSPLLAGFKLFGTVLGGMKAVVQIAIVQFQLLAESAGSTAAAIAAIAIPLAAVVAVGYGLKTTWDSYQANAHEAKTATGLIADQVKKTGESIKTVFAMDLKATFLGKALGKGGLLDKQNASTFVRSMKIAGVSVQDLTGHIGDTDKEWKKFTDHVGGSLLKKNDIFAGDAMRSLDHIRQAYEGAVKALKPYNKELDDNQKKVVQAAIVTSQGSQSTGQLASDTKLLTAAVKDVDYGKLVKAANTTVPDLTVATHALGLEVKDTLGKDKWDPKEILAARDEMQKFIDTASGMLAIKGPKGDFSANIMGVTADQLKFGAAGIASFLKGQIDTNTRFTENMRTVIKKGLDPGLISQLLTAGPEKAGPILDAIVKGNVEQNIAQFNVMSKAIADQATFVAEQARLLYLATQGPAASEKKTKDLPFAQEIVFSQKGGKKTAEQLAIELGLTPEVAKKIAAEFRITIAPTVVLTEAQKNLDILKFKIGAYAASRPKAIAGLGTAPADLGFTSLSQKTAFYNSLDPKTIADLNKKPANDRFDELEFRAAIWRNSVWTAAANVNTDLATAKLGALSRLMSGMQTPTPTSVFGAKLGLPGFHIAEGGMFEAHNAVIAKGGAMRVWAEPETGGEAYIPLSPSKRARSMDILGKVASTFGQRVVPYANGGMTSGTSRHGHGGGDIHVHVNGSLLSGERDIVDAIVRAKRRGLMPA